MSWTITPSFTQWTPALISTALWLDAADASTVTLNGSTVSQWRDKSGNSRHASQATAVNQPTYAAAGQNSQNVLTFDGSNDSLALAADLDVKPAHSIFVAARNSATITAATSAQILLSGSGYTAPSTTTSDLRLGAGSITSALSNERLYSIVVADNSGVADIYGYGKTDADVSGGFFLSSAFTTTSSAFTGRLNGSESFATIASPAGYSSVNTRYPSTIRGIGYNFTNGSLLWDGQIWEIIVAPSYLTLDVTQRIEGYLAHKWGLTANLPANHPYKVNPPAP